MPELTPKALISPEASDDRLVKLLLELEGIDIELLNRLQSGAAAETTASWMLDNAD